VQGITLKSLLTNQATEGNNPFLPITEDHLSNLSKVIEIWILEFVQAISDRTLNQNEVFACFFENTY
jgi:hypothetical protein